MRHRELEQNGIAAKCGLIGRQGLQVCDRQTHVKLLGRHWLPGLLYVPTEAGSHRVRTTKELRSPKLRLSFM